MAGTYTDIISITAPSSAASGEIVSVTIEVKNISQYTFTIPVTAYVNGDLVSVSPSAPVVAPGTTQSYSCSFTMPGSSVTLTVKSWVLVLDDEETVTIALAGMEKWVKLALTVIHLNVPSQPPPEKWMKLATTQISIGVLLPKEWVKLATSELSISSVSHQGKIVNKQLDVENEWRSVPQDVPPDTETRVKVITRNTGATTYRPTCIYEVTDSDGVLVERYEHTASSLDKAGPSEETSFYPVFDTFILRDEGDYNLEIWLYAYETGTELDHWKGKLCTVKEGVVPPPPSCTPGETKCIGFDLYECSPSGDEWVLIEENSTQCAAEKEGFPWLLVAGALGAGALALIVSGKKKPTKVKKP